MSAPAELVAALPQYEIGESIGEGGMGVVFAGVHRTLEHLGIRHDHRRADRRHVPPAHQLDR